MRPFPLIFLLLFSLSMPAAPAATEAVADAKTPLLTEEKQQALFAALDPAWPALAPVHAAVTEKNYETARRELAGYLRTRTLRTWQIVPHRAPYPDAASVRYHAARANAAAEGRVVGGLVALEANFPGNRIDWLRNETRVRAEHGEAVPFNPEWQWQLCRMAFWGDLASAYRATGDERYARAWVTQFRSFIEQCPAPDRQRNGQGSAWRTIECGIRMSGSWPAAFHSFLFSPSVSDEDLLLYLHASLEHARYLKKFPTSGNWLTMEMNGLYSIGVVFPEFAEAASWRRQAIDRLHAEVQTQFLPDGAHYELTPGYHQVALGNIVGLLRTGQTVGRRDEFPADYIAQTERAYDFNLRMMTPDRSLPELNDSWPVNVRASLRGAREFFPQRDDFRWIATDGREGRPPSPDNLASHALPYAGYFVMRSGWGTDANYLLFDAGPLGYGHVHQDKLNLVLWTWGRELLFDGGGGSYERSRWRSYGVDTFSHNTVLVDGKPQRRPTRNREANVSRVPLDAGWESTPAHDYARGVYSDGYGNETDRIATHVRRVYFHKPDVFVVADTLSPADAAEHTYQARWHLLTTKTRRDAGAGAVVTADAGQPNLAIVPLLADGLDVAAVSGQTEPELLGWDVRKDTVPQNVPATTVTHTRRGSSRQSFLTLLLPLRADAGPGNPIIKTIEPAGGAAVRVTLADGRILSLASGADPDTPVTVSETR
ncbi:Heparinase II/III-like protein [Opitutaceae bacterium TAV1]|nr:Heparinase II/III-like protein [Opitutaceae bacterium TAV1]